MDIKTHADNMKDACSISKMKHIWMLNLIYLPFKKILNFSMVINPSECVGLKHAGRGGITTIPFIR